MFASKNRCFQTLTSRFITNYTKYVYIYPSLYICPNVIPYRLLLDFIYNNLIWLIVFVFRDVKLLLRPNLTPTYDIHSAFVFRDESVLSSIRFWSCLNENRMFSTSKGRSMRSKVEMRMKKESGKTLREIRRAKKIQKKLMTDEERLIYNLKRVCFFSFQIVLFYTKL